MCNFSPSVNFSFTLNQSVPLEAEDSSTMYVLISKPYHFLQDTSKDVRMRKRLLYIDITRRGPEAFRNLLDALSENGYWDLVRDLDPSSSLHARNSS